MVLPNGRVTISALHLTAYLSSGFGPAGPPAGLLDRTTYSVSLEHRLSIMLPEDFNDSLPVKLLGDAYELEPIVGWFDGIETRPTDYVSWSYSSNPFVPGDRPLDEADTDEREVRTNFLSQAEAEADGLVVEIGCARLTDAEQEEPPSDSSGAVLRQVLP